MRIYTKTGDKGETGIIGKRLSKNSLTIQTIGTIDELNASIGLCIANMYELKENLTRVQSTLFSIGAILANGKIDIDLKKEVESLEQEIDRMDKELKPLKNFILPGGSLSGAQLHVARTICRRAERDFVEYLEQNKSNKFEEVLKYLNRLSDYLFTLARYTNLQLGISEDLWREK